MNEYLPGLEGVPATRSNISFIDGEKGILAYRGYPIEQLAARSSFEETALLLLNGNLPRAGELSRFDEQIRCHRPVKCNVREMMKQLPANGHPMEVLQTAVASLGMFYPCGERMASPDFPRDLESIHNLTVEIIARMPAIVTAWEQVRNDRRPVEPHADLSYAGNLLYMFRGEEPDPVMAKIMDTCLVLHAEHTINASTFAALVAGSTLASPYSVVASAIGTLSGPLHGGANQKVVDMLREIGRPEQARRWLEDKLETKAKVWGFGHREYKVKDPRARILQRIVERLAESRGVTPLFETALALEEAAAEPLGGKGVYPNVDFYSGILYSEMGIPPDQFTAIFAIARSVGWLAHWREQLTHNRIFRPTQVYTGEPIRDYIPIDQRR